MKITVAVLAALVSAALQAVLTAVDMTLAKYDELALQKQEYDVVWPWSPQPETMSRTIVLSATSAHDVRDE